MIKLIIQETRAGADCNGPDDQFITEALFDLNLVPPEVNKEEFIGRVAISLYQDHLEKYPLPQPQNGGEN